MTINSRRCRCAYALGGFFLFAVPMTASAAPVEIRAGNRGLAAAARSVGKGAGLRIKGLTLQGQTEGATLDLKRFEVWGPDAVVEVDGQRVTPPSTAYFRGKVAGDDGSVAVVSVRESGEVQGMVQKGGHSWLIGKGRNHKSLHSRSTDDSELPPFECGNDDAFSAEELLGVDEPAPAMLTSGTVLDQTHVATIALDSDYEYYAKFGNVTNALDYMGDLIGYADVTYSREINTDMQIGFSRLWTGGAGSDPWTALACVDANGDGISDVTPCGTSGALTEFRNYWNANMTGVNRTLAHMLSGKGLGGGIAYVGVLCQNYSTSKGSTSDYGVSASLGGTFVWDGDQTHNPSNVVWDIVVTQHEIGHNFNSPHTHDYCNIGNSALPIDNCYAGCQAGATVALPTCSQPTPRFTTGGGAGTIMSYCHLRSGGYGNIAMTFGEGHTCGTLPGREADRMSAFVTTRASTYPTCFAPTSAPTCGNGLLDSGEQCDGTNLGGATCTSKGFAGGTLSCSSSCTLVTSACTASPCGNGIIDSGEQCDGANLGGATCVSKGFGSGTLSCSSTCTLNTSSCSNCGNNVINAGEVCDGTALGGSTCALQGCTSGGVLACNSTCSGYSTSACFGCPVCDHDGVCEAGEVCSTCSSDCASGTTTGARCGNGICEAGNGEDCLSCPSDCNGVQGGKTSSRYCCGDGSGVNAVPCSDARCTAGRQCTTATNSPSSYCCGDGVCGGGESCSTCALDCKGAVEICGNGMDDNCNSKIDCTDTACSTALACQCRSAGTSCTLSSQCCSGSCATSGKNPYTCN